MSPAPKTKPLTAGDEAPDFELKDERGELHSLERSAGHPLVLVFYPGDLTPGCSIQLKELQDALPSFQAANVEVMGVNRGSAQSHATFCKRIGLSIPLLVDEAFEASKRYGATRTLGPITVIRRTVVGVDANGNIAFVKRGMPKAADILKAFKS